MTKLPTNKISSIKVEYESTNSINNPHIKIAKLSSLAWNKIGEMQYQVCFNNITWKNSNIITKFMG